MPRSRFGALYEARKTTLKRIGISQTTQSQLRAYSVVQQNDFSALISS
jgi:hypothetical protein